VVTHLVKKFFGSFRTHNLLSCS